MKKGFLFLVLVFFIPCSVKAQKIPEPNCVDADTGKPCSGMHSNGSGAHGGNNGGHGGENYPPQPSPNGTRYPGYPNVVWDGTGHIRPANGYTWENPNDLRASKYRVVPLPPGTPYENYPNVVWDGKGNEIRAADGYRFENQDHPWANSLRVVPLTTKETYKEIANNALPNAISAIKDQGIMDWMLKNVKRDFRDDPGSRYQMSPWVYDSGLVFTWRFLTETSATRENLVAFELGKFFYTITKDKPDKNGKTLEAWFFDFSARYGSVIWDTKNAQHKNEDLSILGDLDITSKFGYVFRAQALELDKPKDRKARREWDKVMREFQAHVNPLLRDPQMTSGVSTNYSAVPR